MKNTLKLLLLVLSLHPALLSAQTVREAGASQTITDSTLAFSIKTPFKKATLIPQRNEKDIRATLYFGTDSTENTRYIFGRSIFKPGSFQIDDSSYYSRLTTGLRGFFRQLSHDTVYFVKGCFVEDLEGLSKDSNRLMKYRHIIRGNTYYTLIADFPLQGKGPAEGQGPTAKVRAFFDSFSMLDYPVRAWNRAMAPDSSLTTWAPTPLILHEDDSSKNFPKQVQYLAFDSAHFNSYFISRQEIPPYYWCPSDSALCADLLLDRISPNDSVVYKRPVSNGDAKGWEWMQKARNGLVYRRARALVNGDHIYFLFTYTTKDDAASPNTNRFFEDFRFARPVPKTHVFDSKATVLLDDLFGSDPVRAAAALTDASRVPFGKEDLTRLHALMLKLPPYKGGLNDFKIDVALTNRIIHINDSSSFRWAAAHYKTLSASQDYIKGFLLKIMGSFPSQAHYSEMAALLQASPPKILPIDFLWLLGDHLRQTARIMPQLLAVPTDSLSRPFVIDLAGKLADSNLLSRSTLLPFQRDLLRFAAGRVAYLSTDYGSPRITDGALISLLGLLNTDASNAALRAYLDMEFHDERIKAFAALLRNGNQGPEDIQQLAEDKSTRLDLYRVLEKAGRLPLFPMAFRTQKMLSESAVYAAVMAFELEPPSSFDFIDMKVTGTGTASKSYFFYKIKSQNGSTHLAWAGPYGEGAGQTTDSPDATAIYDYLHPFDPVHAQEQISGLLVRSGGRF